MRETRRTSHTGKQNASAQAARSPFLASVLGRGAVGFLVVLFSLNTACAAGQEVQAGAFGAQSISDAEAVGIVLTALTMGVSSGHLALRRSSSTAVQALAKKVIDDNIVLDMHALRLLKQLSLKPIGGPRQQQMERQAKESLTNLAATEQRDFDRGYLAYEIAYRREFLRVLDETLIPSAGDKGIRLLLLRVRSSVNTQLERAEVTRLGMYLRRLPTDRFPSGSGAVLG
jgi:predicted outer membrane protein